jgi:hypothetical protein
MAGSAFRTRRLTRRLFAKFAMFAALPISKKITVAPVSH